MADPTSGRGAPHPQYVYGTGASVYESAYLSDVVLDLLTRRRIRSVIDVGCGNGVLAALLMSKGLTCSGFDASTSGIELARATHPGARFEVGSVYDAWSDIMPDKHEAVVSLEVIEHLYDPKLFARRAFEYLTPRGTLILSTPYHGYLKNLAIAVSGKFDAHVGALWDGGHIKFFSRTTLTTLVEEAGFRVVSFAGAGRMPWLWKSMVMVAEKP